MIAANIEKIKQQLPYPVKLVAVSKTRPVEDIKEAYDTGHRAFGENKVQELVAKQPLLPADIEWHLIGHLQSNKVKYIAPFVHLIHSVDSFKLLETINKEGIKNKRVINCLLQVHIANEETKFGLNAEELDQVLDLAVQNKLTHVAICGLMGMATNTNDTIVIEQEFTTLKKLFDELLQQAHAKQTAILTPALFNTLSMGMSSDYLTAIKCGSTLVRVGSSIFGER